MVQFPLRTSPFLGLRILNTDLYPQYEVRSTNIEYRKCVRGQPRPMFTEHKGQSWITPTGLEDTDVCNSCRVRQARSPSTHWQASRSYFYWEPFAVFLESWKWMVPFGLQTWMVPVGLSVSHKMFWILPSWRKRKHQRGGRDNWRTTAAYSV